MDGAGVNFDQSLRVGRIGEGYIATWLRSRGYNVLPVYEKELGTGKGPALFSVSGDLIAPDMLVFGSGDNRRVYWIEAKTKSAFTFHRLTGRWTTGIDLRHYYDYLRVSDISPWPVWLLFLQFPGIAKDSPEGCPYGLFGRELGYLRYHENHRHSNGGRAGMVYWAHDQLLLIAKLEDVVSVPKMPT